MRFSNRSRCFGRCHFSSCIFFYIRQVEISKLIKMKWLTLQKCTDIFKIHYIVWSQNSNFFSLVVIAFVSTFVKQDKTIWRMIWRKKNTIKNHVFWIVHIMIWIILKYRRPWIRFSKGSTSQTIHRKSDCKFFKNYENVSYLIVRLYTQIQPSLLTLKHKMILKNVKQMNDFLSKLTNSVNFFHLILGNWKYSEHEKMILKKQA